MEGPELDLMLKCISGSQAYGLDQPGSDTDIRGVFVLPRAKFYGLSPVDQVSDEKNDVVFYELKKIFDLWAKNNPNALELLLMPPDCVLYRHPLAARIQPELFLSKLCRSTFAGYAMSQIKRARGLHKKILNPLPKKKKSVLDFCYVAQGNNSLSVKEYLQEKGWKQTDCGLAKIPNMKGVFALYHGPGAGFAGIVRDEQAASEVALSSIPKSFLVAGLLYFNQDAYSLYCREYREDWEWVEKRNEARYESTLAHGKRYDAKHMMHTFRLLAMAEEIATTGTFSVRREHDREYLLRIRHGEFDYDELVARAEDQIQRIDRLFEQASLPEEPDLTKINALLVELRTAFYHE